VHEWWKCRREEIKQETHSCDTAGEASLHSHTAAAELRALNAWLACAYPARGHPAPTPRDVLEAVRARYDDGRSRIVRGEREQMLADLGREFGVDAQAILKRLRRLRRIEQDERTQGGFECWRAGRPRVGTKRVCFDDGRLIPNPEHPDVADARRMS
jgi:hypothetical protein